MENDLGLIENLIFKDINEADQKTIEKTFDDLNKKIFEYKKSNESSLQERILSKFSESESSYISYLKYKFYSLKCYFYEKIGKLNEAKEMDEKCKKYKRSKEFKTNMDMNDLIKTNSNLVFDFYYNEEFRKKITDLIEILKASISDLKKIETLNKIANYCIDQAKDVELFDKVKSLLLYEAALDTFNKSIDILIENNKAALIGHAKCLIELARFKDLFSFLEKFKNVLQETKEYWILRSVCLRKKLDYEAAKESIQTALNKPSSDWDKKALKEQKIIDDLIKQKAVKAFKSEFVFSEKCFHQTKYSSELSEKSHYKVLSVDGGGIRGVIPTIWLNEIEKETKKPISSLFDMFAGTSTGSIIAAGLAIPKKLSKDKYCTFTPRYSTYDLYEIYRNKAVKIFGDPIIKVGNLTRPKYDNAGLKSVLKEYFEDTKLSTSLVDLVIPSVNLTTYGQTYKFSSIKAKFYQSQDDLFADAVLASASAPTYFPPHKIANKGEFVDGGVTDNNPSRQAFIEARILRKIPLDSIYMLSLGTGACVSDPIQPNKHSGLLYWAVNISNLVLNAQVGNIEMEMKTILDQKYNKWQLYLDEPIELDNYQDEPMNKMIEYSKQFIEELKESNSNSFNKLIEILTEKF